MACRLCLCIFEENDSTISSISTEEYVSSDYVLALELVPELNLELSRQVILCQTCVETLEKFRDFVDTCKYSERTLFTYKTEHGPIQDLRKVINILPVDLQFDNFTKNLFCCICFKNMDTSQSRNILDEPFLVKFLKDAASIKEILSVPLPVLCDNCTITLEDLYSFKQMCNRTQDSIEFYSNKINRVLENKDMVIVAKLKGVKQRCNNISSQHRKITTDSDDDLELSLEQTLSRCAAAKKLRRYEKSTPENEKSNTNVTHDSINMPGIQMVDDVSFHFQEVTESENTFVNYTKDFRISDVFTMNKSTSAADKLVLSKKANRRGGSEATGHEDLTCRPQGDCSSAVDTTVVKSTSVGQKDAQSNENHGSSVGHKDKEANVSLTVEDKCKDCGVATINPAGHDHIDTRTDVNKEGCLENRRNQCEESHSKKNQFSEKNKNNKSFSSGEKSYTKINTLENVGCNDSTNGCKERSAQIDTNIFDRSIADKYSSVKPKQITASELNQCQICYVWGLCVHFNEKSVDNTNKNDVTFDVSNTYLKPYKVYKHKKRKGLKCHPKKKVNITGESAKETVPDSHLTKSRDLAETVVDEEATVLTEKNCQDFTKDTNVKKHSVLISRLTNSTPDKIPHVSEMIVSADVTVHDQQNGDFTQLNDLSASDRPVVDNSRCIESNPGSKVSHCRICGIWGLCGHFVKELNITGISTEETVTDSQMTKSKDSYANQECSRTVLKKSKLIEQNRVSEVSQCRICGIWGLCNHFIDGCTWNTQKTNPPISFLPTCPKPKKPYRESKCSQRYINNRLQRKVYIAANAKSTKKNIEHQKPIHNNRDLIKRKTFTSIYVNFNRFLKGKLVGSDTETRCKKCAEWVVCKHSVSENTSYGKKNKPVEAETNLPSDSRVKKSDIISEDHSFDGNQLHNSSLPDKSIVDTFTLTTRKSESKVNQCHLCNVPKCDHFNKNDVGNTYKGNTAADSSIRRQRPRQKYRGYKRKYCKKNRKRKPHVESAKKDTENQQTVNHIVSVKPADFTADNKDDSVHVKLARVNSRSNGSSFEDKCEICFQAVCEHTCNESNNQVRSNDSTVHILNYSIQEEMVRDGVVSYRICGLQENCVNSTITSINYERVGNVVTSKDATEDECKTCLQTDCICGRIQRADVSEKNQCKRCISGICGHHNDPIYNGNKSNDTVALSTTNCKPKGKYTRRKGAKNEKDPGDYILITAEVQIVEDPVLNDEADYSPGLKQPEESTEIHKDHGEPKGMIPEESKFMRQVNFSGSEFICTTCGFRTTCKNSLTRHLDDVCKEYNPGLKQPEKSPGIHKGDVESKVMISEQSNSVEHKVIFSGEEFICTICNIRTTCSHLMKRHLDNEYRLGLCYICKSVNKG